MAGSLDVIAINLWGIRKKGRFGKGKVVFGLVDEFEIAIVFFLEIFDVRAVVAVGIGKFVFDDALEVTRHFYDLLIYIRRVGALRACALGLEDAEGFEFSGLEGCDVVVFVVSQSRGDFVLVKCNHKIRI